MKLIIVLLLSGCAAQEPAVHLERNEEMEIRSTESKFAASRARGIDITIRRIEQVAVQP